MWVSAQSVQSVEELRLGRATSSLSTIHALLGFELGPHNAKSAMLVWRIIPLSHRPASACNLSICFVLKTSRTVYLLSQDDLQNWNSSDLWWNFLSLSVLKFCNNSIVLRVCTSWRALEKTHMSQKINSPELLHNKCKIWGHRISRNNGNLHRNLTDFSGHMTLKVLLFLLQKFRYYCPFAY